MFDPEKHILENFDTIRNEFRSYGLNLFYYDKHNWGGTDYSMPNKEYMTHWVKGWNNSPGWLSHALVLGNAKNDDLKTTKIFQRIVEETGWKIVLVGYAVLMAGEHLPPHTDEDWSEGWDNVWHLGLECPREGSYLVVDGEAHKEETGKLIKFDDSKEHFAVNLSSKDRVILYIKFSSDDIDFMDFAKKTH